MFSGATGLIYEVLWARMLGLVFGATTLAVSTVLAAFMGGLALGSALAGRFASRIKRPLSAYGWLEIGIAFYALLVPFLFHWVDNLYALIWQQLHPGFFAFSLWRFALSCVLLLVPTTLMGATLPVLSAALLNSSGHSRGAVTKLYACNLAGAILGTLAAGFVLLPVLGVRTTILVAAVINTIIGAAAVIADRKNKTQEANSQEEVGTVEDAVVEGQIVLVSLRTGVWLCNDQHAGRMDTNLIDDHWLEYLCLQYRGCALFDRSCRGRLGNRSQRPIRSFARDDS
jgi:spermidine synthase